MVEKFGTLDIATASFMPISIVPGVTLIGGNVVLDPAQRTYSFVRIQGSGEPLDDSFVTVHIDTGAVISNPAIGDGFNNPAYDPVTGNVFALHWDAVAMVEKFGTLDVVTATFSPIATLPGVTLIAGEVVLDPLKRTYSFRRVQGPGEPLGDSFVTVDIDSGGVISNPIVTDGFNDPAYDPVTGNVFALHWDAVAMVEKFGTLDVATATFSPIAPLPGVTLIGGDAVLNPVARTYSFRRAQGSGEPSGNSYVTVDIDTGAVISNPLLTDGFNYPRALY